MAGKKPLYNGLFGKKCRQIMSMIIVINQSIAILPFRHILPNNAIYAKVRNSQNQYNTQDCHNPYR